MTQSTDTKSSTGARASDEVTASWGADAGEWGVLVHGGAGDLRPEHVDAHIEGCLEAARVAADLLKAGATALDAVERAVSVLEDNSRFNAGTGACLNAEGRVELDAALMEGAQLRGGGVCALPPFLHPIEIARAALEEGRHVLYAGEGAARFAREHGFVPVTSEAMTTEAARKRLAAARSGQAGPGWAGGTVGAVARDARGNVAAATSTGGLVNKHVGRVGDSPILGAGTYADNEAGACSATGIGEAIMRLVLAKATCDALRAGAVPEQAVRQSIAAMGRRLGGTGGLIAIDRAGRLGLARNTATMSWAASGATLGEASGV
jgi:L-asparaginase / beta-aspartyl-peptidase